MLNRKKIQISDFFRFLFFRVIVIFVPQFSINFHDNSNNNDLEIDFLYDSAHFFHFFWDLVPRFRTSSFIVPSISNKWYQFLRHSHTKVSVCRNIRISFARKIILKMFNSYFLGRVLYFQFYFILWKFWIEFFWIYFSRLFYSLENLNWIIWIYFSRLFYSVENLNWIFLDLFFAFILFSGKFESNFFGFIFRVWLGPTFMFQFDEKYFIIHLINTYCIIIIS